MAPITRSWDPDLLDARLHSVTMEAIEGAGQFHRKVTQQKTYSQAVFKDPQAIRTHTVEGTGPAIEYDEAVGIPSDDLVKGPKKTTGYKKIGLSVGFTEESMQDDLYNIHNQGAAGLGESIVLYKDYETAKLFDNATSTTYYTAPDTTGDGLLPLCSITHGSARAGYRGNMLGFGTTVAAGLGYESAQQLLSIALKQTNHRGLSRPAIRQGDKVVLLVQVDDLFLAHKLFGPNARYEDTNHYAQPNVLGIMNWEIVATPLLSASTAGVGRPFFFLNGSKLDVWQVDRTPVQTRSYVVDNTNEARYCVSQRLAWHVSGWTNTYGGGL